MGLEVGNKILAEDFIALKARVKAECNRRKYKGSIAKYGGSEYDYTVVPTEGDYILSEHLNKLVEPMNQINDTGYTTVASGSIVRSLKNLEEFITASEAYPVKGTSSNCRASCTGLCLGGCGNTCQGCSGTCSGSCQGNCSGGCGGSCGGTCSTGCYQGDCSGTCYDKCTNTCQGACTGGCKGTCKGSCGSTQQLQ